jgi:cytochrome P450 family 110
MNLPDGPRMPYWLTKIRLALHPIEFLEELGERYGDAFTLGDRNRSPIVYLSHPQAIKELLTANPDLFDHSSGKTHLEPFIGKHSILLTDGELHQRQRRLLMPPFHGERMRAYGQLICDTTQQAMARLTIGQAFPVRPTMEEITLNLMLKIVFGLYQGQRYEQIKQLILSFLRSTNSPLIAVLLFFPALRWNLGAWSIWGRFMRLREQIYQLLSSEIQERRQSIDSSDNDILSLLLSVRDDASQPLTDIELQEQLITLLLAGYETTASILTWGLYSIHHFPEVKSKLESEISTIPADASPSVFARLPYLNAVCQETLRFYPVSGNTISRVLKAPWQVMDYQFEPGTTLIGSVYLIHHRSDLYPQPKQFKPEHFLERQFAPYEFLPFGGGCCSCIGNALAQFEMKLVLATIVSHWQMALIDRRSFKPVRRGPTIAPPSDMRMVVTGQRQSQKVLAAL